MRKLTKLAVILLMVVLILPGCKFEGNEQRDSSKAAENKQLEGDYKYTTNDGITINLDQDVTEVLDSLGKPMETFEAPSCAFNGVDKTFLYGSYQIVTYPIDNEDHISTIDLLDDTVITEEGISLGSTQEEVVAAYGEDYSENNGFYTYTSDKSQLTFATEDGVVKQITYSVILGKTQ
jgi:hypothetical protein